MPIPTENVGSLPRPAKLQAAIKDYDAGKITQQQLTLEQDAACLDSIKRMEATGAPIVSDGEQRASSFATYPLTDTLAGTGLAENLAADGQYFAIFTDGHHRQLPRLTGGPFRYKTFAADYLEKAVKMASKPLKQAVIAPSMLALLYPLDGEVKGYTREQFLSDLCNECEKDIRKCFAAGAARVSMDYAELLPSMFKMNAGYFLIQLASEKDKERVYKLCGQYSREDANGVAQVCFIGVIDPLNPRVETAEEVCADLVLASKYIPTARLGSTDDCGFSPFSIDVKPKHGSPDAARDIA